MGKLVNFYQEFNIFEKIVYKVTLLIGYGIGYLTLIPSYLINGSFRKPFLLFNQSESIEDKNGDMIFTPKAAQNKVSVGFKNFISVPEIIKYYSEKFGDSPYMGTRPVLRKNEVYNDNTGKIIVTYEFGDYEWKTYKEVYQIIEYLAAGLLEEGLSLSSDDKLVIFCDTREEWMMIAIASMLLNVPVTTIFSALDDDAIVYAINLVEAKYIMVDQKALARLKKLESNLNFLQKVIVVSNDSTDISSKDINLELIQYSNLLNHGKNIFDTSYTDKLSRFSKFPDEEDVALIMFTSGSTGVPKAVVIKHKNILTHVGSVCYNEKYWHDLIYPAFLPLAHILEFASEIGVTSFGGKIGYSSSLTLTDKSPMIMPGTKGDLSVLKPTIGVFVPLLLDRLAKSVISFVRTQSRLKRFLFQWVYTYKAHFIEMGYDSPIINTIFFKKVQQILGGRLRFILSGGSFLTKELEIFCTVSFCTRIYQGYGLTETCAGGALFNFSYPVFGSIGAPNTSMELKLVPWEEGDYFPSDKPNPRGEVLLCGGSVTDGYYKQPELTNESFILDSNTKKIWFSTGDIGEMLPNGTLNIIDRKKDIIKLQHGEYIPLTKVEHAIGSSNYIDFCAAMPSSESTYLVAVIVPNRDRISSLLIKLNIDTKKYENINEIIQLQIFKDFIMADVYKCIKIHKLSKFETPSFYHIVTDQWTPESNLVTPTMKLRRAEITKFYKQLLLE